MPVKKTKGRKKATTGGKKKGIKKGRTKKGKKGTVKTKVAPPVPDPLSYDALLNAYYIAHGPVQFLEDTRGYKWAGASKKKKGKGKKKK